MEVVTQYTLRDLIAFQRIYAKTLGRRKTLLMRGFYCLFGFLGLLSGCLLTYAEGRPSVLVGVELLVGALFLCAGIFYYRLTAWSAKRVMPKEVRTNTFLFGEEEITIRDELETSKLPYRVIKTWGESRELVALFFSDKHGLLLPKRDIPDPEALRAFLQEKLPCGRVDFDL
ncbi:YcxB family protein [Oscillibacter hominis]|uniref:YcxB family protein n=1 Tax=Oscillibacter hominis TaxID=2763056 RepID=A0A7G9B7Y6_9FIRM|nr:YcxB family protein [Oscillibacter hominis]QNL45667.1 YcxB family protein [Oscillibacter hominis]